MAGGYFVSAQFGRKHCGADVFEQTTLSNDVAHVRKIVQRDGFGTQQCRSHARQRRILGAAYRNTTAEWLAAGDAKFIHAGSRPKSNVQSPMSKSHPQTYADFATMGLNRVCSCTPMTGGKRVPSVADLIS